MTNPIIVDGEELRKTESADNSRQTFVYFKPSIDKKSQSIKDALDATFINWSVIRELGVVEKPTHNGEIADGDCFLSTSTVFLYLIRKNFLCRLSTAVFHHDLHESKDLDYKTHHCFLEKNVGNEWYVINVSNLAKGEPVKIWPRERYKRDNCFGEEDYIDTFTPQQFRKALKLRGSNAIVEVSRAIKSGEPNTCLDIYRKYTKDILSNTMSALSKYEGWDK